MASTKGEEEARHEPGVLLHRISQLVTMAGEPGARRGRQMRSIGMMKDAAVLVCSGQIAAVGSQREVLRNPWLKEHRAEIAMTVVLRSAEGDACGPERPCVAVFRALVLQPIAPVAHKIAKPAILPVKGIP